MPGQRNTPTYYQSFYHPEACPAEDSEARLEKIHIHPTDSFFDILNKLLKSQHRKAPTFNYEALRDCLKPIWENEDHLAIDERALHESLSKPGFTQILISLILTARYQIIETGKKEVYRNKEKVFDHAQATQKRIIFLTHIADILDKKLYLETTEKTSFSFLDATTSDLISHLDNMSNTLFYETYRTHHAELVLHGHHTIKTKERFFKALPTHLEENLIGKESKLILFVFSLSWALACSKYFSAVGHNKVADFYLKSFKDAQPVLEDLLQERPKLSHFSILPPTQKTLKPLLQDVEKIEQVILFNQARKIYISLLDYLISDGSICLKDNSPGLTPEAVLNNLNPHTKVNSESFDAIKEAILCLGLGYQNSYDNFTKIEKYKKILTKLNSLFEKNTGSFLATYTRYLLSLHEKKMKVLEQVFIEKTSLEAARLESESLKAQIAKAQVQVDALAREKAALQKEQWEKMQIEIEKISNAQKSQKERLTEQIQKTTEENAALEYCLQEETALLHSLKQENLKQKPKHALLYEALQKTRSKEEQALQKEANLKAQVEHQKLKEEKLKKRIANTQEAIDLVSTATNDFQGKQQILLQQHYESIANFNQKIRKLNLEIKTLLSQQPSLQDTRAQITTSLDMAYQKTLVANTVNQASNQQWAAHLMGLTALFEMLKSNFINELNGLMQPSQKGVFYAPTNPVISGPVIPRESPPPPTLSHLAPASKTNKRGK